MLRCPPPHILPLLSRLKRGLLGDGEDHQTKERNDRQSPSSPPPLPCPTQPLRVDDEDDVGVKNSRRFARRNIADDQVEEEEGGREKRLVETRLEMGSNPTTPRSKGCRRLENSRVTNDLSDFGNDPGMRLGRGGHEREHESFSKNGGGGGKIESAVAEDEDESEEELLSSSKIPTGNLRETRPILHNGERNANGGSNHSTRSNSKIDRHKEKNVEEKETKKNPDRHFEKNRNHFPVFSLLFQVPVPSEQSWNRVERGARPIPGCKSVPFLHRSRVPLAMTCTICGDPAIPQYRISAPPFCTVLRIPKRAEESRRLDRHFRP